MAFQGEQAELPVGWDGLTGTHNMSQVTSTQLLIAKNITYENGTIQKEGGNSLYGTVTGAPAILAGFDWWPTSSVQRMIALCSDGKLYKDSGAGTFPITLASALAAPSAVPVFAEGGSEAAGASKKLFLATGSNQLQILTADAATTHTPASGPADWSAAFPIGVISHLNRIWGWGGADQHRLYYTTTTNHEDFTTTPGAGSLSIYPGEGQAIVACSSFKGHLIVFKFPKGIYDVDTSDPSVSNWTISRLTRAIGAGGQGCIVNIDNDIIFIDNTGNVHQLSSTQEFGDFGLVSLSDQAYITSLFREQFNLGRIPFIQSILYNAKREIHFAISDIGNSLFNTRRLVIDLNNPPKTKWRLSDWNGADGNAIWLRRDANNVERPIIGGSTGTVKINDNPVKQSSSGSGYEARFKTPHYDLSHIDPSLSHINKNGKFLEFILEPTGNWDLYIDVYWDGKYSETVQVNTGANAATLGTFVLDTNTLASDQILSRVVKINGSGRRISLEGYNANAGEDFSLSRLILHFTPGGTRIRS